MLPYSVACERNKVPILDVLVEEFGNTSRVLEIGSGTGQHATYFASHLSHLTWHPSDTKDSVQWVEQRLASEPTDNVAPPMVLDVNQYPWNIRVDGIFSANTFHIMSWPEVALFFRGVGDVLEHHGKLCVYGPFRYAGAYTSNSNAQFDRSLRLQAPHMGIRDIEAVNELAEKQELSLVKDYDMPANNRLLVWQKGLAN